MRLTVEKRYLCFPVRNGAGLLGIKVRLERRQILFHLELDEIAPQFYVWMDCLGVLGETLELWAEDAVLYRLSRCMVWSDSPLGSGCRFKAEIYTEAHRPLFHFTSPRGWMNDPNGMIKWKGEYHLFYQVNTFGCMGIDKGWGHAKSKNLFDWEILPPGLYADDRGYAISGSALVEQGSGRVVLAYSTRVDGHTEFGQQQNIAFSEDGLLFAPFEGNPVLEDMDSLDFRDPKVFWHEPSQAYVMVVAFGRRLRIYRSVNLEQWTLASEVEDSAFNTCGYVYECPDLMEFDIEYNVESEVFSEPGELLPASVFLEPGMLSSAKTCWLLTFSLDTVRRVVCVPGDFDGWRFTAYPVCAGGPQVVDWGTDFYAAVSFNPYGEMEGRKLWLGWMSHWDYAPVYPADEGWRGMFTVPREQRLVRLGDGLLWLYQNPAAEIQALVSGGSMIYNRSIPPGDMYELPFVDACIINLEMNVGNGLENFHIKAGGWVLILYYDSNEWLKITVAEDEPGKSYLHMERQCLIGSELGETFNRLMTMPLDVDGLKHFECTLLLDKGCVELYCGQGKYCASVLMPTKTHTGRLRLENEIEKDGRVADGFGAVVIKKLQIQPLRRVRWKL